MSETRKRADAGGVAARAGGAVAAAGEAAGGARGDAGMGVEGAMRRAEARLIEDLQGVGDADQRPDRRGGPASLDLGDMGERKAGQRWSSRARSFKRPTARLFSR